MAKFGFVKLNVEVELAPSYSPVKDRQILRRMEKLKTDSEVK